MKRLSLALVFALTIAVCRADEPGWSDKVTTVTGYLEKTKYDGEDVYRLRLQPKEKRPTSRAYYSLGGLDTPALHKTADGLIEQRVNVTGRVFTFVPLSGPWPFKAEKIEPAR